MQRKIIKIEEKLCNGCGLCAAACHEGAIGMVNGKAKLLREDYCDGLGDCLPACPTGAISFEVREAPAYDHAAVLAAQQTKTPPASPCGCPGSQSKLLHCEAPAANSADTFQNPSQLTQWPVQIKLVPISAPYFSDANLLIAADCTAFAYGDFHRRFIQGKITLVGCPKLDSVDYADKLTEIIRQNSIKSITVVRMEVPCCGGLEQAVKRALQASGKQLPCQIVVISTNGMIRSEA